MVIRLLSCYTVIVASIELVIKKKSEIGAMTICKTVQAKVESKVKKSFDLHLRYHFKPVYS